MGFWEWVGAFVTVIGGTTAISFSLGYFLKQIADHWLSRRLEQHKAALEAQNEQAAEKLRSELRLESLEHEVRFRHLHERQAQAIAEVYGTLQDLQQKVASYIQWAEWGGEPTKDEKHKLVVEAATRFHETFYPRRIFFPRDLADRIEWFNRKMAEITNDFARGLLQDKKGVFSEEDHWMKSRNSMINEAQPLFREIEEHFQASLGLASTKPTGQQQI